MRICMSLSPYPNGYHLFMFNEDQGHCNCVCNVKQLYEVDDDDNGDEMQWIMHEQWTFVESSWCFLNILCGNLPEIDW